MAEIGKVRSIRKKYEFDFEWRIDNFFALSGVYYCSPSFLFPEKSWKLSIHPNGKSEYDSIGHIGVYLCKDFSDSAINVEYSIWLKTLHGKKFGEIQYTYEFEKKLSGWGTARFIKRSELSEKKSEVVPSGILTIVCSLQYSESTENADDIAKAECSFCKATYDAKDVSLHEDKCLEELTRCPTCNDIMRKWLHHECQTAKITANKKLVDDLEAILNNEDLSDVTIKIKDEEFRLHRTILAGRNPFFCSMFTTDMTEKATGIVTIEDCEPNVFRSFVRFLYTGQIPALSNGNICALYETADKYQDDHLKAECLTFMKRQISKDNFFDFILLAMRHDEKELLENATELFCKETIGIIQNVKWHAFIREYTTLGNELYIKAYKAMKPTQIAIK